MLSRSDAIEVPGGDTVQMYETARQLMRRGVHVSMGRLGDLQGANQFDLVHLFNWEQLEAFLLARQGASLHRLPVVLSPIFWPATGHWYEHAIASSPVWRIVHRSVGASRGRGAYQSWQNLKLRRGSQFRRLRELLSVPAQLLPNSRTEVAHLKATLGLGRDLISRCRVVTNGVNRDLFDPPAQPNRQFLHKYGVRDFVLQVGRIQSAKNQLMVIRALYDTGLPIVFVGQFSPYEADYVRECVELGKRRGNVFFVGPCTPSELAGIYVLAAVHVLPSWRETPGLASLEAAAAGCRVVSTHIGSAREYFGPAAWYCDPGDPSSIRGAVLDALGASGSDGLRRVVLEKYTWEMAAAATLEAYRAAVEGWKPPGNGRTS